MIQKIEVENLKIGDKIDLLSCPYLVDHPLYKKLFNNNMSFKLYRSIAWLRF